ncbi:MAG: succinate dehydrogenase iron-sulfur subunit [Phycisphaerae bacterium]
MPSTILVQVQRQDGPDSPARSESFEVTYEPGMNCTTLLQRIAAHPVNTKGLRSTPVSYDACCLEEVCGACTMVVNGKVQQACTALVDDLLADDPESIHLAPMKKFPKVRDLLVDRSRMFQALKKVHAWVQLDDYSDRGPSPKITPASQESAYPLSRCMTCGCCVEACPQFNDKTDFLGPQAISQAILFNEHPVGALTADVRLDVLAGAGGIADCGNAQACVQVCPKDIPLTESLAKAGRATTLHAIRRWLGR